MPNLATTCLVLLLNPRKYSATDLYPPSHHACTPFGTITKLHLKASHYTPGKPTYNNLVFHRRRVHKTLFSIHLHHSLLNTFCAPTGLALTLSLCVNVTHLMQLTLSSAYPYNWSHFFCHLMPGCSSSARFQCSQPSASASRSQSRSSPPSPPLTSAPRWPSSVPTSTFTTSSGHHHHL